MRNTASISKEKKGVFNAIIALIIKQLFLQFIRVS